MRKVIEKEELFEEIKKQIKIETESMTKREVAIFSLTEYQKELISLGITEKIREETKEEMIKINLETFEKMSKKEISDFLIAKSLLN